MLATTTQEYDFAGMEELSPSAIRENALLMVSEVFVAASHVCGKFDPLTPEVAANPVFEKLVTEYLKVDRLLSRERSSPFP